MFDRLVPGTVATAETREDILDIELFPGERRSMGRAVEKRRREFVTGRACARKALGRLGVAPADIPNGPRGEPLWPEGVLGSITHCPGYRACAVARVGDVEAIGIDAEVNAPLPDGVLEVVASRRERKLLAAGGPICMDTLIFSAKEAVYKAWFPLTRRWLGFEDVEFRADIPEAVFSARLLVPAPMVDGVRLTEFTGRWHMEEGIICTAVVVC